MGTKDSTMSLDLEKELLYLQQIPEIGRTLGEVLRKIQDGINNTGMHIAVDPAGTIPPPPPVQQLNVKTNGTGMVHAVITDNNAIQKNLHYFVEYSTDPAFPQPHVAHLGASRSMEPITLPANDDNGNPQKFYFRAYSQYPGGLPGPVVHFGGDTPTAVNPGGTQNMTLLPSTGSGTAQATGQQGGQGFGKILDRPTIGPKRRAAQ
jgi:hypothetical protein